METSLDQADADVLALRDRLARRGLDPRYVDRVTAELQDHLAERRERGGYDSVALGDLAGLERGFVSAFRAQSWAGRRPWLGLVAWPLVLTNALLIGYFMAVFYGAALIDELTHVIDPPRSWVAEGVMVAVWRLGSLAPFAGAAWLSARAAVRSGRGWGWRLVAVAAPCLLVVASTLELTLPVTTDGDGDFSIDYSMPPQSEAAGTMVIGGPERLVHAAGVGLVGLLVYQRRRSTGRRTAGA